MPIVQTLIPHRDKLEGDIQREASFVRSLLVGLILSQIAVAASAAPYLYVGDDKANCGARFLTNYMGDRIAYSLLGIALCSVAALAFRMATRFRAFNETTRDLEYARKASAVTTTGAAVIFVYFGWSELNLMLHPPALPADVHDARACKNLGWPKHPN